MKKQTLSFKNLFTVFFIATSMHLYAQNIKNPSNTDAIRSSISPIKDKIIQINSYAQQAYNATNAEDARKSGKQILVLLEEIKTSVKNAETALTSFSTPENKEKCGKYINNIASDLADLQNKTGVAEGKAQKIVATNERDEVRHAVAAITIETKKIETIISENNMHMMQTDQKLISND